MSRSVRAAQMPWQTVAGHSYLSPNPSFKSLLLFISRLLKLLRDLFKLEIPRVLKRARTFKCEFNSFIQFEGELYFALKPRNSVIVSLSLFLRPNPTGQPLTNSLFDHDIFGLFHPTLSIGFRP
jgi:hypothetical protein